MKINCIAIEDEPLALKKIKGFINDVNYLNLIEYFDNAVDALGFLKTNTIDLIFLDIRMKKLSGIQLLESLKTKPKVIITTAYDEYALKGYELDVVDYLLKPFKFDRFLKSVEKVYHLIYEQKTKKVNNFILVKTEYRIERIRLDNILYIQGMKDYLQIHTKNKKVMTLLTFKKIMEILPEIEFRRVHNSYIVAISQIESIERNRIYIGNDIIPISDGFKEEFYKLLKERRILI